MNLLEQYIKEIHSVEPYTDEWTEKYHKDFVEVDLTINCYGSVERKTRIFSEEEWEKTKEQGYYMA